MMPKHLDFNRLGRFAADQAGAIWQFGTARYTVAFFAEPEDIDPADSFEFDDDIAFAREDDPAHWFSAAVGVYNEHGYLIGADYLGGCSYNSFREFCGNRYGSTNNGKLVTGGYFPDMVREAIRSARWHLSQNRDGEIRIA